MKPKKGFEGIVVYTIERDGCLNGVYSNTGVPKDRLFNEIARLDRSNTKDKEPYFNEMNGTPNIVGVYTCSWIDAGNTPVNGTLHITWAGDHYSVVWFNTRLNRDVFEGTGFLLGNHMFAVHYTYA